MSSGNGDTPRGSVTPAPFIATPGPSSVSQQAARGRPPPQAASASPSTATPTVSTSRLQQQQQQQLSQQHQYQQQRQRERSVSRHGLRLTRSPSSSSSNTGEAEDQSFMSSASPTRQTYAQAATARQQPAPPPPSAFLSNRQQSSRNVGNRRSVSRPPPATDDNDEEVHGDDEVTPRDYGEELIRRRMKERKLAKQLNLGYGFEGSGGGDMPHTPGVSSGGARSRATSRSRPRDRSSALEAGSGGDFFTNAHEHSTQQPPVAARSPSVILHTNPFESDADERSFNDAGSMDETTASEASYGGKAGGDETPGRRDLAASFHNEVDAAIEQAARSVNEEDEILMGEDDEDILDGGHDDDEDDGDVELTLKDRQDAINIEHPFGLPIWKPALYKKSRSVTRNADSALHSIPSAAAQRHLLPGNLLWAFLFGWWLSVVCFAIACIIWVVEGGGGRYSSLVGGFGWYIGWPFGKYVEGEGLFGGDLEEEEREAEGDRTVSPVGEEEEAEEGDDGSRMPRTNTQNSSATIRIGIDHDIFGENGHSSLPDEPRTPNTIPRDFGASTEASSFTIRPSQSLPTETQPLLTANIESERPLTTKQSKVAFSASPARSVKSGFVRGFSSYGATNSGGYQPVSASQTQNELTHKSLSLILGGIAFWFFFLSVIAPLMLLVCIICWGMVITIPMAKLTWALLKHVYSRPLEIGFRPAPKAIVEISSTEPQSPGTVKAARLRPGQIAPTAGPRSTVLLCTYKAIGLQYYKYTVGGVNILFINLLPLVFFVILDANLLLPLSENHDLGVFLNFITNRVTIFILSLASVIPLSYFIGMAVASISAQSSIGLGAVINATFGSIIEIILYAIALMDGKGRLVEGSIVGSLLAGVLLMPGASMASGAFRRKEQKFNAKSAGVTSTMLIMAIIGTLTPTLFYQVYGTFELICDGCPDPTGLSSQPWQCGSCRYTHPDPASDPFYQDKVKSLMYFCAFILLLSYLIGLWFSLRTHASQIWQNPQQLLQAQENTNAINRASVYHRITPAALAKDVRDLLPTHRSSGERERPPSVLGASSTAGDHHNRSPSVQGRTRPVSVSRRNTASQQDLHHSYTSAGGLTPFIESYNRDLKDGNVPPISLPGQLTSEDFTRAVAAATVTALRHQQSATSVTKAQKPPPVPAATDAHEEAHGGHEAPSWSRAVSYSVLLGCTALYALIAEILVDVVDVVLEGSGIDEKFLGVTLFALVPNTTEFMNAMSFALNGNIALSMEIGSAYALQVCLLQIPAMVAFSALYDPSKMGEVYDTFTLVFPQWDVIAIIFSIFLLTYTYIEARANYHRGSILILAYLVLVSGFYYAPSFQGNENVDGRVTWPSNGANLDPLAFAENAKITLMSLWS